MLQNFDNLGKCSNHGGGEVAHAQTRGAVTPKQLELILNISRGFAIRKQQAQGLH